jgi:ElaB/YqjD/DUF883 family membrane-anchored ribosome-binding protein
VAHNDTGGSDQASAIERSPELLRAEADIARTRERVSQSVMALRQAVAKSADWREWVRNRPGLFIAAAFGVGLIWGHRSGRRTNH